MQNDTTTLEELRAEVAELRATLDAHVQALALIVGEMPRHSQEHVIARGRLRLAK